MSRFTGLIAIVSLTGLAITTLGADQTLVLEGTGGEVHGAAFLPDGKTAITSDSKGIIHFWNTTTGKRVKMLLGHKTGVTDIDVSPNGRLLASACPADKAVYVWNIATGKTLRTWKTKRGMITVAFSGDNKRVLAAGYFGNVHLWDAATNRQLKHWDDHLGGSVVAIAPNGLYGVLQGGDRFLPGDVRLLDMKRLGFRWAQKGPSSGSYAAFSPDSKLLATADNGGRIVLWKVASGEKINQWNAHRGRINGLTFSQDGKLLVSGGIDSLVKVWNANSQQLLKTFEGHKGIVWRVAIGKNARLVLSAGADGTARIWPLLATDRTIASTAPVRPPSARPKSPVKPKPTVPKIRVAEPDANAQKEALAQIRQLIDFKGASTPQKKIEMATKLMQVAEDTVELPSRFVLLDQARLMAAAGRDVELALNAAEQMGQQFKIDAAGLKLSTIVAISKAGEDSRQLIPLIDSMIDEAMSTERYEQATQMAMTLAHLARLSKSQDLIRRTALRRIEIVRTKKVYDQAQNALATLKTNPDDAQAQLLVGEYLCLLKGDWQSGLPSLAKSNHSKLKSLAKMDMTNPSTASEQVKLADGWWTYAEGQSGYTKQAVLSRASKWYRIALPQLLGIAKLKVEKRLQSLPAP